MTNEVCLERSQNLHTTPQHLKSLYKSLYKSSVTYTIQMVSAAPCSFKVSSLEITMAVALVSYSKDRDQWEGLQTAWFQLEASTGDHVSWMTSSNTSRSLLQMLCLYVLSHVILKDTFTIAPILQGV